MAENTYYATGRRKRSIARVWIVRGGKGFIINGQQPMEYLKRATLNMLVDQPMKSARMASEFGVRAKVHGGGVAGQAGAIQLGIARALVQYDEKLRSILRQGGFLTRDPREKERKKFGRKGARRSFQYTKR